MVGAAPTQNILSRHMFCKLAIDQLYGLTNGHNKCSENQTNLCSHHPMYVPPLWGALHRLVTHTVLPEK
jgi:hypothetical protein